MKRKNPTYNALSQSRDRMTNSYALPSAQNKQFMAAMRNENAFRSLATIVNAPGSDRTIFTCDAEDIATWLGDGSLDTYYDGVDDFKKLLIHAHRLGTVIRIYEDFLTDTGFSIQRYMVDSFAKRIGHTEEEAFVNGDGTKTPTGILAAEGGAEVGVTSTAITYDDVIRLYFSVKKEYRKNGVWMMNDETTLALRTLKDADGNYIWNHANDTILGRPVVICKAMPNARVRFTIKIMEELYALHQ